MRKFVAPSWESRGRGNVSKLLLRRLRLRRGPDVRIPKDELLSVHHVLLAQRNHSPALTWLVAQERVLLQKRLHVSRDYRREERFVLSLTTQIYVRFEDDSSLRHSCRVSSRQKFRHVTGLQ